MTAPEKPDLLPCPLCNKAMQFRQALWISDGDTDSIIHAEEADCGIAVFLDGTSDHSIIAKWNRRPSPPPASVEAVELDEAAFQRFLDICENPPPPTPALRALFEKHKDHPALTHLPAQGAVPTVGEIANLLREVGDELEAAGIVSNKLEKATAILALLRDEK